MSQIKLKMIANGILLNEVIWQDDFDDIFKRELNSNIDLLNAYKRKMMDALDDGDEEIGHIECDGVLCDLLNELGFGEIVEIYEPALVRVDQAEPIEIIMDPGEVFRIGDSNAYIYLLQSILIQLSNDNPSISPPDHNGVFDNPTSEALAAFQFLAGIPPTGELDKNTWKFLVKQFTLSASKQKNMQ